MLLRSAVHALLAYAKNNPKSELAQKSVLLYLDDSNCAHGSPHSSSVRYLTLPSNLLTLSQYILCTDKRCFSYKEIMGDSPLLLQYLDRLSDLKEVKYEIANITSIGRLLKDANQIINELQILAIKTPLLSGSVIQSYKAYLDLVNTTHTNFLASGYYVEEANQRMAEFSALKDHSLYLTLTNALGGEHFNLNGQLTPHLLLSLKDLIFLKENISSLSLPRYDRILQYNLEVPVRNLEEYKAKWQLEVLSIVETLIHDLPNTIKELHNSNKKYLARKFSLNRDNSLGGSSLDEYYKFSKDLSDGDYYTEIWVLNEVQARFLFLRFGISALPYDNNNLEDLSFTNQLLLESETLNLIDAFEIAKVI